MKLCFIANARLNHTWRWIQPLVERGHEVSLLSYAVVDKQPEGIKVVDLTRLNNVPRLRFAYWALWLRQYLRQEQPEILHVHQVQAAGWLGWLSGYHPLVVSAWGSDLLREPHKNQLRGWLVRRVLAACDRLVAASPVLKAAALELGLPEERITTIPWGIDVEAFSPLPDDRLETRLALGLDPEDTLILCPRSPAALYNIRQVVQAFGRLALARDSLRLVLLEYNPDPIYVQTIKLLVKELNLDSRIIWLPPQPDAAAMARLYRAVDLIVSVPESEGYGLSVYEAMACGCPAVISDLPVFADVIWDGQEALKVPAGKDEPLAEALARLLDDPGLRRALSEHGRRLTGDMSSRRMANQAEELYTYLAG